MSLYDVTVWALAVMCALVALLCLAVVLDEWKRNE